MTSSFSLDNPVFRRFAFYSSVVLVKTMAMSEITAWARGHNQVFANDEDIQLYAKDKQIATIVSHPTVERLRRCHLNDLENVIPFVLVGMFYVSTDPDTTQANYVFKIFTLFRLFHSCAYILPLPQPGRSIGFLGGYATTLFMVYKVLRSVL